MRAGEKDLSRYSIFPQMSNWFSNKPKSYVGNAPVIKLEKGYDLALNGEPTENTINKPVTRFAINATDFRGCLLYTSRCV